MEEQRGQLVIPARRASPMGAVEARPIVQTVSDAFLVGRRSYAEYFRYLADRSASRVKQMPRVSYRAQQWRTDHDPAGTSFSGSAHPAVRSRRAQELDRSSI